MASFVCICTRRGWSSMNSCWHVQEKEWHLWSRTQKIDLAQPFYLVFGFFYPPFTSVFEIANASVLLEAPYGLYIYIVFNESMQRNHWHFIYSYLQSFYMLSITTLWRKQVEWKLETCKAGSALEWTACSLFTLDCSYITFFVYPVRVSSPSCFLITEEIQLWSGWVTI